MCDSVSICLRLFVFFLCLCVCERFVFLCLFVCEQQIIAWHIMVLHIEGQYIAISIIYYNASESFWMISYNIQHAAQHGKM